MSKVWRLVGVVLVGLGGERTQETCCLDVWFTPTTAVQTRGAVSRNRSFGGVVANGWVGWFPEVRPLSDISFIRQAGVRRGRRPDNYSRRSCYMVMPIQRLPVPMLATGAVPA